MYEAGADGFVVKGSPVAVIVASIHDAGTRGEHARLAA